jgi:hypothetical protein
MLYVLVNVKPRRVLRLAGYGDHEMHPACQRVGLDLLFGCRSLTRREVQANRQPFRLLRERSPVDAVSFSFSLPRPCEGRVRHWCAFVAHRKPKREHFALATHLAWDGPGFASLSAGRIVLDEPSLISGHCW